MPADLAGDPPETAVAALVTQIDGAEVGGHESLGDLLRNFERQRGRGGWHGRLLLETGKAAPHFQQGEPIKPSPGGSPSELQKLPVERAALRRRWQRLASQEPLSVIPSTTEKSLQKTFFPVRRLQFVCKDKP